MVPLNKLADRLLRLLVPETEAAAAPCSGQLLCDSGDCYWYCCTERGCYRWGTCC